MRRRQFITLVGGMAAYIRDGRLKAFGVASETRVAELADFPAISETHSGP